MSANIYYEQVKPNKGKSLGVMAPSSFIGAMQRAFGKFPVNLDKSCIAKLQGMASTWENSDIGDTPFDKLIEAVEKLEEIFVYAEY